MLAQQPTFQVAEVEKESSHRSQQAKIVDDVEEQKQDELTETKVEQVDTKAEQPEDKAQVLYDAESKENKVQIAFKVDQDWKPSMKGSVVEEEAAKPKRAKTKQALKRDMSMQLKHRKSKLIIEPRDETEHEPTEFEMLFAH